MSRVQYEEQLLIKSSAYAESINRWYSDESCIEWMQSHIDMSDIDMSEYFEDTCSNCGDAGGRDEHGCIACGY